MSASTVFYLEIMVGGQYSGMTGSATLEYALGNYLYTRLRDLQIYAPKPQGGFYLFPDFSRYKERLMTRGIHNSSDLCDKLLNDTGVALLPSFDFGRPFEKLTARLSYVDFDGENALKVSAPDYADKPLDKKFIQRCCPNMIEAMNRMEEWMKNGA